MKKFSNEVRAADIISELLVRELETLRAKPELNEREVYSLERLSRVFSTLMDEVQRVAKDPKIAALLQGGATGAPVDHYDPDDIPF